MADLTNNERLNLEKMIKASDAEDNTEKIRTLKHSKLIEDDIQNLLLLSYNPLNLHLLVLYDKTMKNLRYHLIFVLPNFLHIHNFLCIFHNQRLHQYNYPNLFQS